MMTENLKSVITYQHKIKCPICQTQLDDNGFILECPTQHEPTLLTTNYSTKQFKPDEHSPGIFRYRSWLPIIRNLTSRAGGTVTYQSQKLNQRLGLPNLWIAFNGYWSEKGATLESATFKDLEAYAVLSRIPDQHDGILVVPSAGNTAAAFAHVCSQNQVPCLIIIPQSGLCKMQFSQPLDPYVKVVSLTGFTDYYDAIALANRVSQLNGFFLEGGVKNVGRRDGIGTTLLNAVERIGQLPDYYFQAIGSGAGGIAVHEAAKRLVADGQFGQKLPRLMLSQNFPFVPIYNSWHSKRRELVSIDSQIGKKQIQQIVADVLSNRQPPYSVKGGVFDVLTESQGDMLIANNLQTISAIELFKETEGVHIEPAAGVALATLHKAVTDEQIDRTAIILLHITGGRWHQDQLNQRLIPVEPSLCLDEQALFAPETLEKVIGLFGATIKSC